MSQTNDPVLSEKMYYQDRSTGLWIPLGSSLYRTYENGLSKTDTVRRPKPVDLFASGTPFAWNRIFGSSPVTTFIHNGWKYRGPLTAVCQYGAGGNTKVLAFPSSLDGRLRSKIKSSNLNLAQSLAEYRQTSKMFASLAMDVVNAFRAVRSGRVIGSAVKQLSGRGKSPTSKAVANRWLEYQYGLKPALSDLYGSAEALAKKIRTGFPQYVSTHGRDGAYFEQDTTRNFDGAPFLQTYVVTQERQLRAKARYVIKDAALKQLSEIGITNPALLAWELVPYSFVIDWLIPVGDFLGSLDALVGVEDLKVLRSYKDVVTYKYFCPWGANTYVVTGIVRDAVSSSGLSLPSLRYKPSTSFTAVANGVALLRQLQRDIRGPRQRGRFTT
jgi:hypothetical protein